LPKMVIAQMDGWYRGLRLVSALCMFN